MARSRRLRHRGTGRHHLRWLRRRILTPRAAAIGGWLSPGLTPRLPVTGTRQGGWDDRTWRGRLDCAGSSYHAPVLPAVGRDQAGADSLGRWCDGGLPALIAHGVPVGAVEGGYMIVGSLGCGDSGVVSTVIHGASGSASRIACIWAASRAWYRPTARPSERVHSRSRCP